MKSVLRLFGLIGLQLVIGIGCFQRTECDSNIDLNQKSDSATVDVVDSETEPKHGEESNAEPKRSTQADAIILSEDQTRLNRTYEADSGVASEYDKPKECTDLEACESAERCASDPCSSECDGPLELVVPDGEIRYLQGEHFYCRVEIRGTLELPKYNFAEGGELVLRAKKDIVILSTGLILADGAGYPSDKGPGAGLCIGGGSSGGTYGGLGGQGCCNLPEEANIALPGMQPVEAISVYGESATQTIEMGSGGGSGRGCSEGQGGSGGGAITLIARDIIIEGTISTDGTPELTPSKWSPGAGSGGGVLAMADERIVVSGRISACGGTPSEASWGGGGGSGGRVKLFAPTGSVTGETDVAGGDGGKGTWDGFPGQEGSVHISF